VVFKRWNFDGLIESSNQVDAKKSPTQSRTVQQDRKMGDGPFRIKVPSMYMGREEQDVVELNGWVDVFGIGFQESKNTTIPVDQGEVGS
jgi:hypothetical protein